MTAPPWYNEGKKLVEGETYFFNFIRLIKLTDEMHYMLMEDPFGIRHLIAYEYYINYQLIPGNIVKCMVDRINCTGRVFLEPEHPLYRIDTVSDFRLSERNPDNAEKREILVVDVFNNEIGVEIPLGYKMGAKTGSVKCRILGFKKGKPLLSVCFPQMDNCDF